MTIPNLKHFERSAVCLQEKLKTHLKQEIVCSGDSIQDCISGVPYERLESRVEESVLKTKKPWQYGLRRNTDQV